MHSDRGGRGVIEVCSMVLLAEAPRFSHCFPSESGTIHGLFAAGARAVS